MDFGDGFLVAWDYGVINLVKASVGVKSGSITPSTFDVEFNAYDNYVFMKVSNCVLILKIIRSIEIEKRGLTYMFLFQNDLGAVVFIKQVPVGILINYEQGTVLLVQKCQQFKERMRNRNF